MDETPPLVQVRSLVNVVRERHRTLAIAALTERLIHAFGTPRGNAVRAYAGPDVDALLTDVRDGEGVPADGIALLRSEWVAGSARLAAIGVVGDGGLIEGDGPILVVVFGDFDPEPGARAGDSGVGLVTDRGFVGGDGRVH